MRQLGRAEVFAFMAEGTRTGHLATVRVDGTPHVAPVWFVVDGDDLVFTTWHASVKARNLVANPRVALSVDDPQPPYSYAMVEGAAQVEEVDADGRAKWAGRMGARYMGAGRADEFARRNGVEGELVVRITVERAVGHAGMTD